MKKYNQRQLCGLLHELLGISSSTAVEIDRKERLEDIDELIWLIDDVLDKAQIFLNIPYANDVLTNIISPELDKLFRLRRQLEDSKSKPLSIDDYLKYKYLFRIILKCITGTIASSDWQAPADSAGIIFEHGLAQTERDEYMRSGGSNFVKKIEVDYFREYYMIADSNAHHMYMRFTSSGMKALEMAIISYLNIQTDLSLPVYYQSNFYYEGITLIQALYPTAQSVATEELYQVLASERPIGCLLVEPSTTWPVGSEIDFDLVIKLLKRHKQKRPLFVIVDKTLSSIFNQPFLNDMNDLSKNVVIVTIESALKYYQFGLDLVNLGMISFYGKIFRFIQYRELLDHLMAVLTAIPDHGLILRLPSPNYRAVQNRLLRMARNCDFLYRVLLERKEEGGFYQVFRSFSDSNSKFSCNGQVWRGNLLYVMLRKELAFSSYITALQNFLLCAPKRLCIQRGGSFGFDTLRLCCVEDFYGTESSALRISVGRDTVSEMIDKCRFFYETDFIY